MAQKKQITKPEPSPQETAEPQPDTNPATTIKLKATTKSRLELLKGIMKIDDFDAVVCRLIDNLPSGLSTEAEIHLVLSKSKYTWLLAKQDTCDCRNCLNDARV